MAIGPSVTLLAYGSIWKPHAKILMLSHECIYRRTDYLLFIKILFHKEYLSSP